MGHHSIVSIRHMAEKCQTLIGAAALNPWQTMFLEGACFAVLVKEDTLTDKQAENMEGIYREFFGV